MSISYFYYPIETPALRPLVRSLWGMSYGATREPLPGLIAPNAHVEFVFQTGAPSATTSTGAARLSSPQAMIYGLRQGMLRLNPTGANSIVACRTSAMVGAAVLGRPLIDCWDRPIALSDFIGGQADDLLGRIAEAPMSARGMVIESWLIERLTDWDADDARNLALHEELFWRFRNDRLGTLADKLGTTARTLRRRCVDVAGLSPKQLVTSGRVLRACLLLRDRPALPISAVAHELGFGDQAAFANMFRRYFGMTPAQLRAEPVVFCERPDA